MRQKLTDEFGLIGGERTGLPGRDLEQPEDALAGG
jgi:hypothetical protein